MKALIAYVLPEGVRQSEARILGVAGALIVLLAGVSVAVGHMWILATPLLLLLLLLLAARGSLLLYLIIMVTPFSVEAAFPFTHSALQMPTEPIILALLGFWALHLLYSPVPLVKTTPGTRWIRICLGVFLTAMVFSVVVSTRLFVSLKMLAVFFWYITSCYVFVRRIMGSPDRVRTMIALTFVVANIVVAYALIRHLATGFDAVTANESPRPFFPEHGSYAAYIALVLGPALGLSFGTSKHRWLQYIARLTSIMMITGIVFSYTRAAWIAVLVVLVVLLLTKIRHLLSPRTFIALCAALVVVTAVIVNSGAQAALERNVVSMGDVENNISNLERFNRWVAAINMIRVRPVTGFGIGTYPDNYYLFRDSRFTTPISDMYAMAHNDYLLFFAEGGVFCFMGWVGLIITLIAGGVLWYSRMPEGADRNLLLGCVLGILTYAIHGIFNDFLFVDKVAVPFWIFAAIAVLLIDQAWANRASGGRSDPVPPRSLRTI